MDSNLEYAKAIRTKAASEAIAQEEDYAKLRAKKRDKGAVTYNAIGLATGSRVITARDDDVIVPTSRDDILKIHGASAGSSSTEPDNRISKSYELMHLLTGRGC